MKPVGPIMVSVERWVCSTCSRQHEREEFAEDCCKCSRCGRRPKDPSPPAGCNGLCRGCGRGQQLRRLRSKLEEAERWAAEQKKRAESCAQQVVKLRAEVEAMVAAKSAPALAAEGEKAS